MLFAYHILLDMIGRVPVELNDHEGKMLEDREKLVPEAFKSSFLCILAVESNL